MSFLSTEKQSENQRINIQLMGILSSQHKLNAMALEFFQSLPADDSIDKRSILTLICDTID